MFWKAFSQFINWWSRTSCGVKGDDITSGSRTKVACVTDSLHHWYSERHVRPHRRLRPRSLKASFGWFGSQWVKMAGVNFLLKDACNYLHHKSLFFLSPRSKNWEQKHISLPNIHVALLALASCMFLTQRRKGKEELLGKVFILTITKLLCRTNIRRNVWQSVRRTEYDCWQFFWKTLFCLFSVLMETQITN